MREQGQEFNKLIENKEGMIARWSAQGSRDFALEGAHDDLKEAVGSTGDADP